MTGEDPSSLQTIHISAFHRGESQQSMINVTVQFHFSEELSHQSDISFRKIYGEYPISKRSIQET